MVSQDQRTKNAAEWGFDRERMQQELAAQLQSLSAASGATTWLGNASVLRQLARVLAEHIDDVTDRIVVPSTPAHHALGAALACATGLRWTALDVQTAEPVVGEVHQGERLALIGIHAEHLAALGDAATLEGQRLSVFAGAEASAGEGLFRVEPAGHIAPASRAAASVRRLPDFFDPSSGQRTAAADDPAEIERVGALMALHLQPLEFDAVLVWRGDAHAALAQVVAARCGVRVLRADTDLGLLSLDGEHWAGDRVALISARWMLAAPLEPLVGLAVNSGLHVVAALSIDGATEEPAGWPEGAVLNTLAGIQGEMPHAAGA